MSNSPTNDELAGEDAVGLADRIRRGDLSPVEAVQATIDRIERLDGDLNAVIHKQFEDALELAASPDLPDGPFRGVPMLLKDLWAEEAGRPHHAGIQALKDADHRSTIDSNMVTRYKEAGFVIVGRTNTPELALMPTTEPDAFGPTRNPWSLDHSSGGSSGGASAAVAAGLVPAAHASDGGGSIRGPASMCSLVGLKPTRARNSFGPGMGERWSGFSAEFVVTRSVRDSAALLDVTSGPMPGDPYSATPPARPYAEAMHDDPGRLRVGVMKVGPRDIEISPESEQAAGKTAEALEALGHHVEEAYPPALDDAAVVATYVGVVNCNVARALDAWGEKVGRPVEQADVEPLTWALAQMGRKVSGPQHLANVEFVHARGRRLAEWWDGGFDLLLTPTCAEPPPPLGSFAAPPGKPLVSYMRAAPFGAFTAQFNLSGQPAISLPLHWSGDGLPVGVQLVAPLGREDVLLRVAAQLEQAAPWDGRLPPIHASR